MVPDTLPAVMPENEAMCRTCGIGEGEHGLLEDGRCPTCHAEDEACGDGSK